MSASEKNNPTGGLDGLLNNSKTANQYFASLPDYVQEMILQRRQSVHTEDELKRYGENLTQGDK